MTLRLVLGDQLHIGHPWFTRPSPDVTFLMMEVRQETDYARHHIQKIAAFFAAMRAFAATLEEQGHRVRYLRLDDADNRQDIPANLSSIAAEAGGDRIEYMLPDEYRLDHQLREFAESTSLPCGAVDSGHFLTERKDVENMFAGKTQYLMERFYRDMRRKHDVLMENGEPAGGRWNYDRENRKRWNGEVEAPGGTDLRTDVSDIVSMLRHSGVDTMGNIDANALAWPVTRGQALQRLAQFIEHALPHFGTWQDAMSTGSPFLFHSLLSFALNVKLLHPMEVIRAAEDSWRNDPARYGLPQVEGFIRQILGWREYMRGIYWAHMPEYAEMNALGHDRALPAFFWTAETGMSCMRHTISQSLEHAYAHHIQRLMVTGNFALLAGIDPDEVDSWYLGIYIDAIEWVEITNTRGMSQYADGGIVGSKPYVSSANYINRMSDYCGGCRYDRKKRHGDDACPFNSLYWHFLERHRDRFSGNPRMAQMYRVFDRMDAEERRATLQQAETWLAQLEAL